MCWFSISTVQSCPRCHNRFPDGATFCLFDGATLAALSDGRLGTAIAGRYVLEEVIGEGGMAVVYRARHKLVDSLFAVKVMNPMLARDPVVRERFRREAASAKKIAHPNIIEIFEEGDTGDGTAYLVMEYLTGSSLADIVSKGPIPVSRAIPLMIQMARGIARAHDLGVIHRDLKPENIFVTAKTGDQEEGLKLLDFGIALSRQDSRLTGTGELFGTPQYMAPERITSIDAGPSADLYSLGVIFFEMVTGRLPFDAPDIASFFVRHLKEPPLPIRKIAPQVPESLAALVEQLLAKEPKQRPVDSHKVTSELVLIAQEIGARVPPDAAADPLSLRAAALPVSTSGVQRWTRRASLFKEMLAALGNPQAAQTFLLDQLEGLAAHVGELKQKSVEEQRKLEESARKGRDGRTRLGFAVDALGVDASKAREELRTAEEALELAQKGAADKPEKLMAAVKEVNFWEGRCGMAEPTKDLADAYRKAGAVVDDWLELRAREKRAATTLDKQRQTLRDLEYQITELRESLAKHEAEVEFARADCERHVSDMGREIEGNETELLELATTFCAPLRNKPELVPLFARLEAA